MPANVRSFEAIQLVRDELVRFNHRATDGLEELQAEIRRIIDWVEHDRPAYWRMRVSKAYDAVTEAKAALLRCQMYPINDEAPSCAEEKAVLKKAQAFLAHCQQKQEMVGEWARKLRHELHEYEGRTARMKSLVEIDNPKAIALLERTSVSLERYASGGSGSSSSDTEGTTPDAVAADGEASGEEGGSE